MWQSDALHGRADLSARQWRNLSSEVFLFYGPSGSYSDRQGEEVRPNTEEHTAGRSWPCAWPPPSVPRPGWPPLRREHARGNPPLRLTGQHFVVRFTCGRCCTFLDLRAKLDCQLEIPQQLCDLNLAPSRTWAPGICRLVRRNSRRTKPASPP